MAGEREYITSRTYRVVPQFDRESAIRYAIAWAGWGVERTLSTGVIERTEVGDVEQRENGGWTVTVWLTREGA